jgi:hypothetical protein
VLDRLFPKSLTADYRGSWIAVWLLAPLLIVKTVIGFNFSGLNPFIDVAQILEAVDGVPLSTFSPDASAAVVDSAHAWGMAIFTLCLFVWLVLVRYRAALPLAVLLLLIEQVGRTGAGTFRVARDLLASAAAPSGGALINSGMTLILITALMFSLMPARSAALKV